MIELEKLYESAGKNLAGASQDWVAFSSSFKGIFDANFVLYRPVYENGVLAWRSLDGLIAISTPELAQSYIENRVFESRKIPEESLNPLEPSRRSDVMPDDEYRAEEIVKNYFIPNGIFFMLAVLAILPDDSFLMLVAWRDEQELDFSDLEKQRIALFMRYLATLVRVDESTRVKMPAIAVKQFGTKYGLTDTESDVLGALLKGHSLRQIAQESGRAYGTVRWHVQNILEKCQVKTQKNLLSEFYRLIKR